MTPHNPFRAKAIAWRTKANAGADRITCQDTSVRAVIARYHEMIASEVAE